MDLLGELRKFHAGIERLSSKMVRLAILEERQNNKMKVKCYTFLLNFAAKSKKSINTLISLIFSGYMLKHFSIIS